MSGAGSFAGGGAAGKRARLALVEEELYQVRNRSGPDPLNFPIKLTNRIAALRRSVETGDAKPTDAALRMLEELSAELERQLSALDAVVRTDLAALNRALAARKLEPVPAAP